MSEEIKVSEMQEAKEINDEDLLMLIQKNANKKVTIKQIKNLFKIIDNLTSASTTDALSANQGKVLNDKINGTVLYENEQGTRGDIQLSDSYINYKKFDIYVNEGSVLSCYNTGECAISYTKPIGVDTVSIQIKAQQIFFKNNNTITRGMGKTIGIGGSGQGVTQNIDENMIITKIVGYK